jgi:hypothetical protein
MWAIINLSDYSGTWVAVLGSENATATGYGGPYDLKLVRGTASIEFIVSSSSIAFVNVDTDFLWDTYKSGFNINEPLAPGQYGENIPVTRLDDNHLKYSFPDGSVINIEINSPTSITVSEAGSFELYGETFHYSGSYRMSKTN